MLLRPCTVDDARQYYARREPIRFMSMQTYGGKDDKGEIPSVQSLADLSTTFMLDGNLKWRHGQTEGIIADWLTLSKDGPYYQSKNQSVFYYLSGNHSEYGYYWMQICSRPLNVLSQNCMDEVHVWIIA